MGEIVASSEDGMVLVKEAAQKKGAGEDEVAAPPSAAEEVAEVDPSVVRWEKCLPRMVMRVLLVEADDSTRQIIAALLRKCSYIVTAVPDGLKAWEVLKERSCNVDLILTEVELPSISGYALLSLIMENDIGKNIPVIMMSWHDSLSTVYKCMLKGAADFLVKPVRKNELRNLWQHVWRRRPSRSDDIGLPDESIEQRKTEATLLDLSLKMYHPNGSVNQANDDRPILNHSDASAFSRYVNKPLQSNYSTSPSTRNQQKDLNSNSDKQLSYYILDHNSDTHGPTLCPQKHVTPATRQPGQAEITFPSHQQTGLSQPTPIRGSRIETLSNGYGSAMPPVYCVQSGSSPRKSPGTVGTIESSPPLNPNYQLNHQAGSSQRFQNMDRRINDATDEAHNKLGPTLEDRGYMSSATDQSANSSFCDGPSHLHSMDSGSNGKINAVSVVKATAECGNEEGFIVHEGTSHRSVQREVALTKFRLKRKDRCFEKKVRYESRKKLAEQRPRVKGQFVRQPPNDPQPDVSSTG